MGYACTWHGGSLARCSMSTVSLRLCHFGKRPERGLFCFNMGLARVDLRGSVQGWRLDLA
jgi:hypothetical protein